jgi:hypothetical protein
MMPPGDQRRSSAGALNAGGGGAAGLRTVSFLGGNRVGGTLGDWARLGELSVAIAAASAKAERKSRLRMTRL